MKPQIMSLLTWYANRIEMAYEYYHEPNTIYEEIKIARKRFLEALKDEIDFNDLSKKEAIELRFCKWIEGLPHSEIITGKECEV